MRRTFAVEICLVTGAYEAHDPRMEPEWPPAPYRVFAAMVAVAGPERTQQQTEALMALEQADPPVIWACRFPEGTCIDPVWSTFVPPLSFDPNEPGRRAQRHAERAVRPPVPVVRMAWGVDLTDEQATTLKDLASRIGYLGRAGCFVLVRTVDPTEDPPEGLVRWEPCRGLEGTVSLRVASRGLLARLDEEVALGLFAEARRGVASSGYRVSGPGTEPVAGPWTRLVVWRLARCHLPQAYALPATEALRAAVLSLLGDKAPPSLVGHDPSGRDVVPHVAYLALVDVGHRWASGRVFGFGVALPTEAPTPPMPPFVQLWGRRFALEAFDPVRAPWALMPWRWTSPSTSWSSVTPVALPWRGDRRDGRAAARRAVRAACRIAGFPEPVEVTVQEEPFLQGSMPASRYVRARVRKDNGCERRRAIHARIRFAEPVAGPVVLGPWRHFGLGLFAREEGLE